MKKYIYLDWNVIQFIKKKTYIEEKSIDGERFGNLVEKLKKRYVFPFSEAHLRDLSISKEEYHDEDLDFLYKISDNNVLGFDDNENLMSQNHLNIKDVFSFILDKQKKEEQDLENVKINYFMPNSFEVDLNKVTEDNILKPFIEQNSGILDTKVFIAFLEYSKENMNDHKFYKQFRNNVASLKKMYQKNDTIINQESIYFKKLIPFLDFILMDIVNSYTETLLTSESSMLSVV